jgi:hypothetical protein
LAADVSTFQEPNRVLAALQAFTAGIMARTYYRYYIEGPGLAAFQCCACMNNNGVALINI